MLVEKTAYSLKNSCLFKENHLFDPISVNKVSSFPSDVFNRTPFYS